MLSQWKTYGLFASLPFVVVLCFPPTLPRFAYMWTLSIAIFATCKWVTWIRRTASSPSPWRNIAYLFAWPGMQADQFLHGNATPVPKSTEWIAGLVPFATGLLLLWAVIPRLPTAPPLATAWVGMVGMVLVLHFGLFQLMSCTWRQLGVDARPLMNQPTRSTSVTEFWGRRWNVAFRDLTHSLLFHPLARRYGPHCGCLLGFFASGLIHDIVISIPASGGYGLPTLYFSLQGLAVMTERSVIGKRLRLGRGLQGRLFTLAVLVAPIGLLFHTPFITEIILPWLKFLQTA